MKAIIVVPDTHTTESERKAGTYCYDIGIGGGRGKDDAVDLGVLRYRDVGCIRKTERRRIHRAIGDSHWRPIGSCIPVACDGIEIPLGTDGVRNAWNEKHQRAADRCHDKCFHK